MVSIAQASARAAISKAARAVEPEDAGLGVPVVDADLADIKASLDGDEGAYARLVHRYENEIAAQMWRFTRDREKLRELVEEVFVEAFLSLASYKAKAPLLHWLRKSATRVGYRHWKSNARERKRRDELKHWSATQSEEVKAGPSEAAEYLYKVLETLPAKERLVLTLLYFEELDTYEIAERVGWSRTLVKVRAYRARQKLEGLLEQAGFGGEEL